LNDGDFYRTQEAEIGYGKSSIHEETVHVLQAIVEGLEDELQRPNAEKRQQLKYLDPVKDRRRRKSIVTNYCPLWITLAIIIRCPKADQKQNTTKF